MGEFSPRSRANLATCVSELQEVFNEVVETNDCTIIVGHRGEDAQQLAFEGGKSRAQWPNSPHNKTPSDAADAAPYPIDWDNIDRFRDFADVVKAVAARRGIPIKWGGDFKTIHDYDHFEIDRSGGENG